MVCGLGGWLHAAANEAGSDLVMLRAGEVHAAVLQDQRAVARRKLVDVELPVRGGAEWGWGGGSGGGVGSKGSCRQAYPDPKSAQTLS